MTFVVAADRLFYAGSGLLLVLLGMAVLLVRPRRRPNLLFALFCATFGLTFLALNVSGMALDDEPLGPPLALAGGILELAMALFLLPLALHLPIPLPTEGRRLLILPAVAASGFVAIAFVATPYPFFPLPTSDGVGQRQTLWFAVGAELFFLALMALRFPSMPERERRQAALMSAALALLPAVNAGSSAMTLPSEFMANLLTLLLLGATAAMWLRNAAREVEPRLARGVAWVILGSSLAGVLDGAYEFLPENAIARTLGVAILGYAILRHQLLGIDLKVRWTIKQSTVAAAFIGVFFVVSEGAASVLSESLGPVLGIAAAGMLVFAIAPLQRAAERVASAAMPGVKAPGDMTPTERQRVYRDQARLMWTDGHLDVQERLLLNQLRESLRLSADEANRLETEVAEAVRP